MIAVYFDTNALFIGGQPAAIVARTLTASAVGDVVTISSLHSTVAVVVASYEFLTRQDGTTFLSVADCLAYLADQFALPTMPLLPFQEALAIADQNIIPPLSRPWRAAPGASANIIVGAVTLVHGLGAVTFEDGSTVVTFNTDGASGGAGFNLDPGDVVVAQYNT